MSSNIVEELRKYKSIKAKLLANSIDKRQKSNTFRIPKDVYIENKNRLNAYKLFLKLLCETDKEKLLKLDDTINSISSYISESSGWWMTDRDGFMYEDNYQNMSDPEFRTFDTYRIYRNEDGYYVSQKEPFNSYFAKIKSDEIAFYNKYKDKLEILHNALSTKENIMFGNYELKSENDRNLTEEITKYLGYEKKEKVKKYK